MSVFVVRRKIPKTCRVPSIRTDRGSFIERVEGISKLPESIQLHLNGFQIVIYRYISLPTLSQQISQYNSNILFNLKGIYFFKIRTLISNHFPNNKSHLLQKRRIKKCINYRYCFIYDHTIPFCKLM